MKSFVISILLLFFISAIPAESKEYRKSKRSSKHKLESWYTLWGIGYAMPNYPSVLQTELDKLKDIDGVSNIGVSIDMLGFYWPLSDKSILGFIISGVGDRYANDYSDLQLNQYLYSASMLHFTEMIGQGFYFRGDIGASRLLLDGDGISTVSSDWGFGALAGAGYAIPISSGTRILLGATFSLKSIESETYTSTCINVDFLF